MARTSAVGSRFFMIKSWTHDNVAASQQDGTWATQPKNADMLIDAFNTCRNVILVFSVNKSTAFQGYVSFSLRFRFHLRNNTHQPPP